MSGDIAITHYPDGSMGLLPSTIRGLEWCETYATDFDKHSRIFLVPVQEKERVVRLLGISELVLYREVEYQG